MLSSLSILKKIGLLSLVLPQLLLAQQGTSPDASIKAEIRFQIWSTGSSQGVQTNGKPNDSANYKGTFYLRSKERMIPVDYDQGRRTREIQYIGPKKLTLYRKPDAEEPEAIASLVVPTSGKFMVILKASGSAESPIFAPILLPYDNQFLKRGNVSIINYTDRKVAITTTAKKDFVKIPPTQKANIPARGKDASSIYLRVFSQDQKQWKPEFARAYALHKNAKTACIIYQNEPNGPIKVKLYSGLER